MSSWASNKQDKMLFENWRSYLAEEKVAGVDSEVYPDSLLNILKKSGLLLTSDQMEQLIQFFLNVTKRDNIVLEAIGDPQRDPRTFSPDTTSQLNALIQSFNLEPEDVKKLEKTLNYWAKVNTVKFSRPSQTAPAAPQASSEEPAEPAAQEQPDSPAQPQEPAEHAQPEEEPEEFEYKAMYKNNFESNDLQTYLNDYAKKTGIEPELAKKHLEMFADLYFRSSKVSWKGANKYTGTKPQLKPGGLARGYGIDPAAQVQSEALFAADPPQTETRSKEYEKFFNHEEMVKLVTNSGKKKLISRLNQYFSVKGSEYFKEFLKAYQTGLPSSVYPYRPGKKDEEK